MLRRIGAGATVVGVWSVAAFVATALAASEPKDSAVDGSVGGSIDGQWHTQKLEFSYSGFTTLYTCDGLEEKVRDILLAFGARKSDVKVRATGCAMGDNRPSRFAWVNAEYSALTPSVAGAGASGGVAAAAGALPGASTVQGKWATVDIAPNRPFYMGDGDCELIEQMRDVLRKGFSLRSADFKATCTPHQITMASYHLKAEVLKPLAP